jgi:hypothetical protein
MTRVCRGRILRALMTVAAGTLVAGCSEGRPPLRIAEPLSPAEEQRWHELWKQGSGPPETDQDGPR